MTVLREAELFRIRIPLVQRFRTANTTTATKDALVIRIQGDHGEGWGECAAFTAPTYTGDTIDAARLVLRDHLLPRLFHGAPLHDVRGHGAARAALECACIDGRLRRDGVGLASYLGARRDRIEAGVAVGLPDDDVTLAATLRGVAAAGYRRVKCKIAPGRDASVLQVARDVLGDGCLVAADANGSYAPAQRDVLQALDAFALQLLEQPLPAERVLDHAKLVRALATPICLDESITSAPAAADAIALHACDAVSVKPARLGIEETRRVHDICVDTGVPAVAGGMLETGIGRAVLVAVAAMPGFTMTGDCAASEQYFGPDGDITEPFVLDNGTLTVPEGPGLGVTVRPEQLARYTVARERILAKDV
jgi:O-succinylbenzoate synthase